MDSTVYKRQNRHMLAGLQLGMLLVSGMALQMAYADVGTVLVDGNTYDVIYESMGVTVMELDTDAEWPALVMPVDAPEPGTLDVTISSGLLESLYGVLGAGFEVLADGDYASFEMSDGVDSHTLSINVPAGTEEVLITVIPAGDSMPDGVQDSDRDPADESVMAGGSDSMEDSMAGSDSMEDSMAGSDSMEDSTGGPDSMEGGSADVPVPDDTDDASKDMAAPDASMQDEPTVECGPGTSLRDGVCELDIVCGLGTTLEGETCVLDSDHAESDTPEPEPASESLYESGIGQLTYGLAAAFVIAGGIGVVIYLMSKASRRD